jgi:hypothetical protein
MRELTSAEVRFPSFLRGRTFPHPSTVLLKHTFAQMKEGNYTERHRIYPARGCRSDIRPPIARFLFAVTRMAWLWLIVRVYVDWEKLTDYSISIGSFVEASKGVPWVFSSHDGFQR